MEDYENISLFTRFLRGGIKVRIFLKFNLFHGSKGEAPYRKRIAKNTSLSSYIISAIGEEWSYVGD